jgi:hypothetical protein
VRKKKDPSRKITFRNCHTRRATSYVMSWPPPPKPKLVPSSSANGQDAFPLRNTLIALGHPQPRPMPIQTNNSMAAGFFANDAHHQAETLQSNGHAFLLDQGPSQARPVSNLPTTGTQDPKTWAMTSRSTICPATTVSCALSF